MGRSSGPPGQIANSGGRIPVVPHNAPFPSYKEARVHHAARRRGGGVAAGGAFSCDRDKKAPPKRANIQPK